MYEKKGPSVLATIGWVAVLANVVSVFVQVRRIRERGLVGVSLGTWSLFSATSTFWIIYGFATNTITGAMGSVLVLPFQLYLVVRLYPRRPRRTILYAAVFSTATLVIPSLLGGWAWGVYGVGLAALVVRVPQSIGLLLHKDATGVSVATWSLSILSSVLWCAYWVGEHRVSAAITTSVSALMACLITTLALWRHHQKRGVPARQQVRPTTKEIEPRGRGGMADTLA